MLALLASWGQSNMANMRKITWADVTVGDIVYIDNYQDGDFPRANPQVSGPYTVHHVGNRVLRTIGRRFDSSFMHYPNNLLTEAE